jgi:hypothetical protein
MSPPRYESRHGTRPATVRRQRTTSGAIALLAGDSLIELTSGAQRAAMVAGTNHRRAERAPKEVRH